MLALFRRLPSCSLIWCQGWFSHSLMMSCASPLTFPFATATLSSSTIAVAFSTSASQSSSLDFCGYARCMGPVGPGCSLMSVLVHAVGLRLCEVWCVAVLRVAVGAIHPHTFRVLVHCRDVKVLVAVQLGVMRILRWLGLGYWHIWVSFALSG